MSDHDFWNDFAKSGSVVDYLKYRKKELGSEFAEEIKPDNGTKPESGQGRHKHEALNRRVDHKGEERR